LVASLDLGSTWIKAGIFSSDGGRLGFAREAAPGIDPATGTFDSDIYLASALTTLGAAVSSCPGCSASVTALACSSQRATMLVVDQSGSPLTPAVSWQAHGTARGLDSVRLLLGEAGFSARTGLPFAPMFPIFRLADRDAPWAAAVALGGMVISLGDFVLQRLGAAPVTDASLAGATGLFNVRSMQWDEDLLAAAGVPLSGVPRVVASGTIAGVLDSQVAKAVNLRAGMPLVAGGGDQPCAILGAGVSAPGEALISLGTSAAVLAPVTQFVEPGAGPIVLPHVLPGQWAVEDFVGAFGSTLDLAARILGWDSTEAMATAACNSTIPLDAPHFMPDRVTDSMTNMAAAFAPGHGSITGDRQLLAALVTEGLAFEVALAIESVGRQVNIGRLRVAGGGARSRIVAEAIAGAGDNPLVRCSEVEAALFGAACLAMSGAGLAASPVDAAQAARGGADAITLPNDERYVRAERFQCFRGLHERIQ
jgi:sugar (pentulose or hexulose) kinase